MRGKKGKWFFSFSIILFLAFFSGCSLAAPGETKALFYENSELVKAYEKEKGEIMSPDVQSDPGYCPVCEL